ncbi:MAG TPA: cyanophycin synthetase, partial [Sphingomicrobium sp.]
MNIIKQRFLRGPNLYRDTPCLLTLVDLGDLDGQSTRALPGFIARLVALVPGLLKHRCSRGAPGGLIERMEEGTDLAHVVEHVAIELQCMAGSDVRFGFERSVRNEPGQYRVVCGYQFEQVAEEAFALAMRLVETCARQQQIDFAPLLAALRETGADCAIGTSTAAVLAAAKRRGIPAIRLTETANLFQLGWGSRQKRLQATITGRTNHIGVDIASDKQLTKTLLEDAGLPVPEGETVRTFEDALRVAGEIEGPVTIKPLDANQGKGVTTVCSTPEEIRAAFDHAKEYGRSVIVEQYLKGRDYRVLVTGDNVAAASWRRPPHITGDGKSTIRELVELENRNPARGEGHTNILTRIPLDAIAQEVVRKQGFEFDSVPQAGKLVELRGNANLSTGGTAEDVTDLLPASTVRICVRAAKTIGLDVTGIDIVCEDISKPLAAQGGGIIEVNAAPGIRMHQYPSAGKPRDAGE